MHPCFLIRNLLDFDKNSFKVTIHSFLSFSVTHDCLFINTKFSNRFIAGDCANKMNKFRLNLHIRIEYFSFINKINK